jgi:hypothetical protein
MVRIGRLRNEEVFSYTVKCTEHTTFEDKTGGFISGNNDLWHWQLTPVRLQICANGLVLS